MFRSDVRGQELAMRGLLIVQAAHNRNPDFLMADVARAIQDRCGVSHQTGYKIARLAIDIMCINYRKKGGSRR